MSHHPAHEGFTGHSKTYIRPGKAYVKKVVQRDAHTYQKYGANYKLADKVQRQNRYQDGYIGAGSYRRRGRRRVTRRHYGYRGRGGFFGDLWGGIKSVGRAVLPVAEQFLPAKYQGLANAANTLLDTGDYDGDGDYGMAGMGAYGPVNSNSIVHGVPSNPSGIVAHSAPMTAMDDSGDIMLSHKEFLGNVLIQANVANQTQSTFDNQVFPLNPGLAGTFPFLSQIAQCFTLYSMQGLMFQYKPTSGEMGVGSQQLGKVIMATDYDPLATPFINSVQMENYQFSNTAKPSIGQIHGVECKPSESLLDMKYVRTGVSKRDPALTDIGLFQIATEGVPFPAQGVVPGTQVVIGELWASYTVKVSRANLYGSLLGQNIAFGQYLMQITQNQVNRINDSPSAVVPLPSQAYTVAANNSVPFNIQLFSGCDFGSPYFGRAIIINWPNQTILGTYSIRVLITCPQTVGRLGNAATNWSTSVNTIVEPPTATLISNNTCNAVTSWVCPYDPTNMTLDGKLRFPPSINPQTGQPIQLTAASPGSYVNYITATSINQSILEGSFITPRTDCQVLEFNCIINAPGITTPSIVLEEYSIFGAPSTQPYQTWQIGDSVQIFITQTNQNGTQ